MTEVDKEQISQDALKKLKSKGIPVNKAHVDYPVRGENHFATKDVKSSRVADLTVTSDGLLVIEQKGKNAVVVSMKGWFWVEL